VVAAVLAAANLSVSLAAGSRLGSSAVLLSLGSGQLGVVGDGLGVRAHTRMPAVGRVSEPMPLALVGAGLWLVASVTIAPLRSMLSTQQLPATIRGLALRSALMGQGCAPSCARGPPLTGSAVCRLRRDVANALDGLGDRGRCTSLTVRAGPRNVHHAVGDVHVPSQ
jgi:hypothetical protein